MKTPTLLRPLALALLMIGVLELTGCAIEYRCPLDPDKKPDSPTACAGMKEALAGAKAGTGGRVSVLLDDKGRLVPTEMTTGKPGRPISGGHAAALEPYEDNDDTPVFREPKVFKAWSSAFVDANGTLHDGHSAWFATPGRWGYGTLEQQGPGADNLIKPASPLDMPAGRVVQDAGPGLKKTATLGKPPVTQQQRDKNALNAISTVANQASQTGRAPANGATSAVNAITSNPAMNAATSALNPSTAMGSAVAAGMGAVTKPAINLDD